jgi:hypothetical protein
MDEKELSKNIADGIVQALHGTEPTKQDKSVMIKLTPEEIKNIMREAATKWHSAKLVNTPYSIEDFMNFQYDIIFGILRQTDPDRFDFKN